MGRGGGGGGEERRGENNKRVKEEMKGKRCRGSEKEERRGRREGIRVYTYIIIYRSIVIGL